MTNRTRKTPTKERCIVRIQTIYFVRIRSITVKTTVVRLGVGEAGIGLDLSLVSQSFSGRL
jgi:hypothetical protein